MIDITSFKSDDYYPLKEITRNSFPLNSFNVDAHLPSLLKGEVYFETLAKKAFTESSSSCLVARIKGKPAGYIIFGFDKKLSEFFGFKTASIMLLCVGDEYQGKGIGGALLNNAMSVLKSKDVRLTTVGTDSNNLSALSIYQKAGFSTRMIWGTYRFYPKFRNPKYPVRAVVQNYSGEKGVEKLVRFCERPISFFKENKIEKRGLVKLRQDVYSSIENGIKKGHLGTMTARISGTFYNKIVSFLTYEEETVIQEFFNSGSEKTKIYRINDLVVHKKHRGQGIATQMLSEFIHSTKDYHFMEIWASMDDWALINVISKCGFRLSHLSTVLHHFV